MRDANRGVAVGTADPIYAKRIELHPDAVQERFERHAAADQTDHGAVLGERVVELVHQPQSARARIIFRNDSGVARDVALHMARDVACPAVIGAAGTETDQEADGFARIEIRFLRESRRGQMNGNKRKREHERTNAFFHRDLRLMALNFSPVF